MISDGYDIRFKTILNVEIANELDRESKSVKKKKPEEWNHNEVKLTRKNKNTLKCSMFSLIDAQTTMMTSSAFNV